MKQTIQSKWLLALIAFYLTTVLNLSFWRYIYQHAELVEFADYIFVATIPIFIFTCLYILLSIVIWPYLTKIIIIPILIISSISNYAMFQLGIYIDSDMIRNVLQTNQREANDLITISGILWLIFMGIIPALLLLFTKIRYKSFFREILYRILGIIICIGIIGGIAAISYKQYAAFGRNNSELTRLINPSNYLYATARYFKKIALVNRKFQILDPSPSHTPGEHPRVFILVVGETSRSMNFSLNGYNKPTNPKLSQQDIINFKNVTSCGTATAISVPCMFSNLPRTAYNADTANYSENLLDILQKSGINVLWRENDDGCKGVCKRVATDDMVKLNHLQFCDGNACFDEVLIEDLEAYLKTVTKDTFIVLHTIGSHGPTYYKRYPKEFQKFNPTCDTAEIQKCSQEAITNTYDNTILYIDHVLSNTIDILKKFPKINSGMLYLSDHGESLGENNVYLHGIPYSIAPIEQISIPMLLWRSDLMRQTDKIDEKCLKKIAETEPLSQDNLFHSILGLMQVNTIVYDKNLNFFNRCLTN